MLRFLGDRARRISLPDLIPDAAAGLLRLPHRRRLDYAHLATALVPGRTKAKSRTTHFGPLTRQVVRGGSSWRLARRWLSVILPFASWPGNSFCDPTDAFGCRLQWLHYFPDLVEIADHRAQCFDQARHT